MSEAGKGTWTERQISIVGICARLIIGTWLVGNILYGHLVRGPFRPLPWMIDCRISSDILHLAVGTCPPQSRPHGSYRSHRLRYQCCGLSLLLAFRPVVTLLVIRCGTSLLWCVDVSGAAIRGYAGCEALAISNWLLKRDDQLGCLFFSPIDYAERKALPSCLDPQPPPPSPYPAAYELVNRCLSRAASLVATCGGPRSSPAGPSDRRKTGVRGRARNRLYTSIRAGFEDPKTPIAASDRALAAHGIITGVRISFCRSLYVNRICA